MSSLILLENSALLWYHTIKGRYEHRTVNGEKKYEGKKRKCNNGAEEKITDNARPVLLRRLPKPEEFHVDPRL